MGNQAYLLGRLLAALEAQSAIKPDRFDGKVAPLIAAIRKTSNKAAVAPIMEELAGDFPEKLSAEEESDFWLGYYHQRKELRESGRVTAHRPHDDGPLNQSLLVRIDAYLKEWTLANGGSELVRSLLADEKARRMAADVGASEAYQVYLETCEE